MKLDKGYETILENNGNNISNDLKYLLDFAIILLNKSKIILIDNIFDHISKGLYNKIIRMISELKMEHTIIIVSNDIKIIRNKYVSQSILISNGKVIGVGKYSELMLNNKDYCEIISKM